MAQLLRGQQLAEGFRQDALHLPRRYHQYRPAGDTVPQAVSSVQQSRQFCRFSLNTDPHRHQIPLKAPAGRRPEHQRQHSISCGGRQDQYPQVDVRVEDAPADGDAGLGQQAQTQHAARQSTGNRQHEKGQAQEPLLPAEGDQGHQSPHRQLYRQLCQHCQTRTEHRHGVAASQHRRQQVPPPAQGNPGQPGRQQQNQIVHGRIQRKHTVYINDCHRCPPRLSIWFIIGKSGWKSRRKRTGQRKSRTATLSGFYPFTRRGVPAW